MTILISSRTDAALTDQYSITSSATIMASTGIASGDDCAIQVKSDIDGWIDSGESLTVDAPTAHILGPITFRISKPLSASPFGLEGHFMNI